ncbi:DUF190 domain-containing protein [Mangrovibacterium lignilyticum]|uniref:DUF190 domain-containing protein n=1 Tax=Mangrovibacterium lignilyticum TaxID=2668052 RepID=UPI0013D04D01|nr:DUF190 domain-containing protein [Mangrovibacterium lignilyticum]
MKGITSLLKIYVSASDMVGKTPLYEEIVREARDFGLGGATVFRGVLSFGASHSIHSVKMVFTTNQVPVTIEIVDERSKIESFKNVVKKLIDVSEKGALVIVQDVEVLEYKRGKKYNQFANF